MATMTSAYANKMLKSLEEDKAYWVNKEAASENKGGATLIHIQEYSSGIQIHQL